MLASLFLRYAQVPQVQHAMGAVAAAAAGLVIGAAVKMAGPIFAKDGVLGVPVALCTLLLAGFLRWPLPLVLLLMATTGVGIAWVRRAP
jgi:chromate transporter